MLFIYLNLKTFTSDQTPSLCDWQKRRGVEHGPKVIRDAGLIDRLSGLGKRGRQGGLRKLPVTPRYVTLAGMKPAGSPGQRSDRFNCYLRPPARLLHQPAAVNINTRPVALERLFQHTCVREQSDLCFNLISTSGITTDALQWDNKTYITTFPFFCFCAQFDSWIKSSQAQQWMNIMAAVNAWCAAGSPRGAMQTHDGAVRCEVFFLSHSRWPHVRFSHSCTRHMLYRAQETDGSCISTLSSRPHPTVTTPGVFFVLRLLPCREDSFEAEKGHLGRNESRSSGQWGCFVLELPRMYDKGDESAQRNELQRRSRQEKWHDSVLEQG